MESVVRVTPRKNYHLEIEFSTGEVRLFDVRPYLDKGVFHQLRNLDLFEQAYVAFDTVCWPNNLDIAPETLYVRSVPVSEQVHEEQQSYARERIGMNSIICDAIRKKAVLRFTYDELPRIVEPQSHGISTAGKEVLRGVQTGGASGSGETAFGKLFEVEKMSEIEETGETFSGPGIGFNPQDKGMRLVHCHLPPRKRG